MGGGGGGELSQAVACDVLPSATARRVCDGLEIGRSSVGGAVGARGGVKTEAVLRGGGYAESLLRLLEGAEPCLFLNAALLADDVVLAACVVALSAAVVRGPHAVHLRLLIVLPWSGALRVPYPSPSEAACS